MDTSQAIDHNNDALRRVLLTLVAMANLAAPAATPTPTISRYLRNAVLRLLRPAESAARRLVVAMGCGLSVTPPPLRAAAPRRAAVFLRGGKGTGLVLPRGVVFPAPVAPPTAPISARRSLALPLLDPLRPPKIRRRWVRQATIPRISTPGFGVVHRVAPCPVPMPGDRLDATRLGQRLEALARALDDLPGQALRFARWRARRDCRLARERAGEAAGQAAPARQRSMRGSPLRPGRPPGASGWSSRFFVHAGRAPVHAVHDILDAAHGLAVRALDHADTS